MHEIAPRRACLIGLGLITQRYLAGLSQSSFFRLCAVADINENAVSREHYSQYPFYSDYKEMLSAQKPDYVIISTPPESHYAIASYCLEAGVNVVIEKPVTLCMTQFDQLLALAERKNLVFRTLFHWHGGVETRAFTQEYDISKITQIRVTVLDPYCTVPNVINPDRRPLMGAWIDSGVNILSMIRLWLPLETCQILHVEAERCRETNMPIYAKADLLLDGVKTTITVDWRKGINQKESYVTVDGKTVYINHSAQSLVVDGVVTDYTQMPRLDEHYRGLFRDMDGSANTAFSRSVHNILLKVNDVL